MFTKNVMPKWIILLRSAAILLMAALTLGAIASAQAKSFSHQTTEEVNAITWSADRKLTWDDYKGPVPADPPPGVDAESTVGVDSQWAIQPTACGDAGGGKRRCTVRLASVMSQALFDPAQSWVKPDKRTDELLRHEQTHFDIAEMFARQKQMQLAMLVGQTATAVGDTDEKAIDDAVEQLEQRLNAICDDINQQEDTMQRDYDTETDHSRNRDQQRMWEERIANRIAAALPRSGGTLGYEQGLVAGTTIEAPSAIFTFGGIAGDLVTGRVIGITPGFDPTLSLLAPDQRVLANNDDDLQQPFTTDARVTVRLPETGVYSLVVGSSNGAAGDFLLRLDADARGEGNPLLPGTPLVVNIPPGAPPQSYRFETSPAGLTAIILTAEAPDFAFAARLQRSDGQIVALLSGDGLGGACALVEPGVETYDLTISSASPARPGTLLLSLGTTCGGIAATPTPTAPAQVPLDALAGIGSTDACAITPVSSNVNLRGGPGTDFTAQSALIFGQSAAPNGRATGSDGFLWWRLPGGLWVRSDVVRTAGNCSALPIAAPPRRLSHNRRQRKLSRSR